MISLHVGQAGNQIGSRLWNLLCHEEEINLKGHPKIDNVKRFEECNHGFHFNESSSVVDNTFFVPRTCFIDTDSQTIDEILTGNLQDLIPSDLTCHGSMSAKNCFAAGKFGAGKTVIQEATTAIRRLTETSHNCKHLMFHHSICGGTGSGLAPTLAEFGRTILPKAQIISQTVIPSQSISPSTTAPYNALLSLEALEPSIDLLFVYENEILYNLVQPLCEKTHQGPSYQHINHIIALQSSYLTSPERWKGELMMDLDSCITNLLPFPELNMITSAIVPVSSSTHTTISPRALTVDAFMSNQEVCSINITEGTYLSCGLIFRGTHVCVEEVQRATFEVRDQLETPFCEWIPSGFKVGISAQPLIHDKIAQKVFVNPEVSLLKLSNHTSISKVLAKLIHDYDTLLEHRAFTFWYINEGMEEGEFVTCQESIEDKLKKMEKFGKEGEDPDAEEEEDDD